MTGRAVQHISDMRSPARLARVHLDATSLARTEGEAAALGARQYPPREGGVWNTFGIGSRVTEGASPIGTISDAVSDLAGLFAKRGGGAADGRTVTTVQ
jgi:hypothetical protein